MALQVAEDAALRRRALGCDVAVVLSAARTLEPSRDTVVGRGSSAVRGALKHVCATEDRATRSHRRLFPFYHNKAYVPASRCERERARVDDGDEDLENLEAGGSLGTVRL